MDKDLINLAFKASYPQATDTPLSAYNKVMATILIAINGSDK